MAEPSNSEDKTISLRIFMNESLRNTFKAVCARQGKNMSEVVTEFVENYVTEHDPNYKKSN
ncbi:plasmid partition protein ParG [Aphanizomenon sp. PH219]|jgi:predicted DNA-binding protein|nr:plasmid partition protein ParG [Aphanizomenon sp. 202]MDK2460606.1 plasmid partition protein ParG [Aphanizomenon sp. PH219]